MLEAGARDGEEDEEEEGGDAEGARDGRRFAVFAFVCA